MSQPIRLLPLVVAALLGQSCTNPLSPRTHASAASDALTSLGTAASFSVLAGAAVTNTGPSVLGDDLGVSPGSAVTGFPPGIITPPATEHVADAVAAQGEADLVTAYGVLAGDACANDLSGQDLAGKTLTPGVYCFSSSAQLTGQLTLDAGSDPNAEFIFQIGSTITTGSGSSVLLVNSADPCNVFWQVGSSATIGTDTAFVGNIVALTSITLTTGASLSGRALARNGAVTLDTNVINTDLCGLGGGGGEGEGEGAAGGEGEGQSGGEGEGSAGEGEGQVGGEGEGQVGGEGEGQVGGEGEGQGGGEGEGGNGGEGEGQNGGEGEGEGQNGGEGEGQHGGEGEGEGEGGNEGCVHGVPGPCASDEAPLCVCDVGYAGDRCDHCDVGFDDDGYGHCVEASCEGPPPPCGECQ